MFKQTHDNKFNSKWFIRHLKENTFLQFPRTFGFQNGAAVDWADAL